MKKITTLFLIVLFCLSFHMVDAYVSVRGYFKSNGTYVQPHVRSNSNGLKYDNYGWKPKQGLYNDSYYNGSEYWKTPTWTTDPDYYEGKILYKNKTYSIDNRPKGMSKREFRKKFNIKK